MKQGIEVVIVNPHHVKKTEEVDDNSPSKSDRKDALVIARLVRDGRYSKCYLPDGVYAELQVLTRSRRQLQKRLNSAINRLEAVIDEYFPEYYTVFKDILGIASLAVLGNVPFPADIIEMDVEDLASLMKQASNNRVGIKRARKLKEAALESIGSKYGIEGARYKLFICLNEVNFYQRHLEVINAEMEARLWQTGIAEYLLSVPGIGVITASSFLGEVGDPFRFTSPRQIIKLAGLNIAANSSGKHQDKTKITKRGRSYLRKVIYLIARTAVTKNQQMKTLHSYFLGRKVNPLSGVQSLIAIGNKMVRIL